MMKLATAPRRAASLATVPPPASAREHDEPRQPAVQHPLRRFARGAPLLRLTPLPLLRFARNAVSAVRLHPIFTPRATFARWRSHRALKAAARAARVVRPDRDVHERFSLHGLTWHHVYIAQDLRRIHLFLRALSRRGQPDARATTALPASASSSSATGAAVVAAAQPEPRAHAALSDAAAAALLIRLERAYGYLLDNVCDVYNSLEKHILFPWVLTAVPAGSPTHRAVALFNKERDRIEDHADRVQARFARLVCSTGFEYASTGACSSSRTFSATRARRLKRRREAADARARATALRSGGGDTTGAHHSKGASDAPVTGAGGSTVSDDEVARRRKSSLILREGYRPPAPAGAGADGKAGDSAAPAGKRERRPLRPVSEDDVRQLAAEVHTLLEDTERLHRTERKLLYPLIATSFSDREQMRLTNVLVYSMRSTLAKFIITVYHQAVEKHASRSEWRWYKREVPLPIRVYTPVWRARLYDGCPLGWLRQTPLKALGATSVDDL